MDSGNIGIYLWSVVGFLAILSQAIWRLSQYTVDGVRLGLTWWQWGILGAWVIFHGYAEGVRGFHHNVAPRVSARALYSARNPNGIRILLGPLFVMGFFHATKKRLLVTWILWTAILCFILLVRLVPQPWRGIVDAGVVVGLLIGAFSTIFFACKTWLGQQYCISPDIPGE